MSENHKVRLSSITNPQNFIVFEVSPELNETRNVNYKSLDLLHMPGSIFAYSNSSTRTFNMVAKLVSRNIEEATRNSENLQLLRSWTMPYFGKTVNGLTSTQTENRDRINRNKKSKNVKRNTKKEPNNFGMNNILGQPPEVLHLNAYTDVVVTDKEQFVGNINNIPVLITQLGNSYPADVTYFPTKYGEQFPVIMTLDVLLTETHSPKEYSNFSLSDYRSGKLTHF